MAIPDADTISSRVGNVQARIRRAEIRYGRPPGSVALLAVSKGHGPEAIRAAFAAGLTRFGESYVQEALGKCAALTDLPLEWAFIGPIQSNKTRDIATHFQWVHSVDRLKIARRLNEQRPAAGPPLAICLQVNVSREPTKSGLDLDALEAVAAEVYGLPRLRLRGLMAIPAPDPDPAQQRRAFRALRRAFESLNRAGMGLDTLSMGMTDDLEAAVAEGATVVRVGTGLFGPRR
ncbi:MAG TPA: YggS family pyridoxal phosphate-dependent enzyme [Gammaproteobacteria bacterium]|nr:YggS family pyridoxal phosphate-dependent enzyme [Gammaproteobacteria bacterium]